MREVEQEISILKNTKYSDLTRPVGAFITFEEEDAYLLASDYEPQYSFTGKRLSAMAQLMGDDLFFKQATEPTNILWENRHLTHKDRLKRSGWVFAIIVLMIIVSFSLIFFCKSYSVKVSQTYPAVDCSVIDSAYGASLEKYAILEY
jgi:hypothetical protein